MELLEEVASYLHLENKVTNIDLFEGLIKKANDSLKTDDLIKISSLIGKYLEELIGSHATQGVEFDFAIQNIWDQFKYIDLAVHTNELNLPADRLGSGFQSLVVISIFRTYCEMLSKDTIFLIEEPEMFLDPHTKKYFYSVLQEIANKGTQVVCSTHSSEFVDITRYKDIKKIAKDSDDRTHVYPSNVADIDFSSEELFALNTAVNNERGELFFSDVTLLVEGSTEKLVYEYLFHISGLPTNLHNVSIIETSGKGAMPKFMALLDSLDTPYAVVYDSDILEMTGESEVDARNTQNNKDAQIKNDNISKNSSSRDNLFMFDPYFEVVAGITERKDGKRDSKPMRAMTFFKDLGNVKDIQSEHPQIMEPVTYVKKRIGL